MLGDAGRLFDMLADPGQTTDVAQQKPEEAAKLRAAVAQWRRDVLAQAFPGAKPLFNGPMVGGPLDFVSVHFYPRQGDLRGSLQALAVYELGKPLVIEEIFPLTCSVEEAKAFIEESRRHADGWISFYWGATIEENERAGDLKGAIVARWLREFSSMSPETARP